MSLRPVMRIRRLLMLVPIAFLFSCDSAEKQAFRALAAAGIEPTGTSLIHAVSSGDARNAELLVQAGVHTGQRDDLGRTPLRIAIDLDDQETANLLLAAGADPNMMALDGKSILGIAASRNLQDVWHNLLKAGAHAEEMMPDGERILLWAVREAPQDFATALVAAGANPNLPDAAGNNALHLALRNGWHSVIHPWIQAGADPNLPDSEGLTPLAVAAGKKNLQMLGALLNGKADPNLIGPSGENACHVALRMKWRDGLRQLAEAGADWNIPDHSGEVPLDAALAHNDRETASFLISRKAAPGKGGWESWLRQCIARRDIRTARMLLSHGADAGNLTPHLEAATSEGSGSFIKLFLDYGTHPGRALEIACRRGDLQNAKLLISGGASIHHVPAPFSGSPLAAAIRSGNDALANLLLDRGADPNIRLSDGQQPLILAIVSGNARTVERLIAAGADPNAPLTQPVSPDFIAKVRPGIMRWLLAKDSNITPIMLVADSGNVEVARALLKAGANKSVWTRKNKMWPVNLAARRSNIAMMRLLLGQDPETEERHLVVSLSEQRVRVFDSGGNQIFTSRISSGRRGYATPQGEFVITNKYRNWTSTIYHSSMPHFQRLSCSDFGFHAGALPGYPASHGCIRMPAGDARKLFEITQVGDRVRIVK